MQVYIIHLFLCNSAIANVFNKIDKFMVNKEMYIICLIMEWVDKILIKKVSGFSSLKLKDKRQKISVGKDGMRHASFFDLKAFRKGNIKLGVPHSGISHAYFRINIILYVSNYLPTKYFNWCNKNIWDNKISIF